MRTLKLKNLNYLINTGEMYDSSVRIGLAQHLRQVSGNLETGGVEEDIKIGESW